MCGINGVLSSRCTAELRNIVSSMNSALAHRGPDDGGIAELPCGVMGMRRLSIIDIAGGHQPMSNSDNTHSIVYNGEIYDYRALRARLMREGMLFKTQCDTEVVLNAYVKYGVQALELFNGMFAFAIVDSEKRSAILARDRIGIKPLFYYLDNNGDLVFSSELNSLLACPFVPRRLDRESLQTLMVDRYVQDPWTLFDGIKQLPIGHYLRWENGKICVRRYAEINPLPGTVSESEAVEELRGLLGETVESQLLADVPVGVFLSGGIDSSTVAAFAAEKSPTRIKTFSIGFKNRKFDESGYARLVAEHLGTEHRELIVDSQGFDLDILDSIVRHVGQPLADPSCVPTLLVSRLAREDVKVVLSGDGGDELFGGYDHIRWMASVRRLSRLGSVGLRFFETMAVKAGTMHALPARASEFARRSAKAAHIAQFEPDQHLRRIMALWAPEELRFVLRDAGVLRQTFELVKLGTGWSAEAQAMKLLMNTFLPGAILTKVDRMSMAASLEVRVPLLDDRIVGFSQKLPMHLKIRHGVGKHVLREAGRPRLPAEIFTLKKRGFSFPITELMDNSFWAYFRELYSGSGPARDLFCPEWIDGVVKTKTIDFQRGNDSSMNNALRIWLLALLGHWFKVYHVSI